MESVTIPIEGMRCDSCVASVLRAVNEVEGVRNADVSLRNHQAVVEYDEAVTSPEKIRQAISETGFEPRPVVE